MSSESSQTGVTLRLNATQTKGGPATGRQAAAKEGAAPRVPGCRIIARLGNGGMGSVFLAEQVALGRKVAIKVLADKYSHDSAFLDRLRNEAEVMAAMSHPNLVACHDILISRSNASLVMEYIPGHLNGATLVKLMGPMPERYVVRVMSDIASGLAYAYEKGYIHRDVKPDNILFAFPPDRKPDSYHELFHHPDFRIVLCDFGITEARAHAMQVKEPGKEEDAYGTPMYMAPEQAAIDEVLDCRVDIFSLGATAYFLATGKEPFAAREWAEIQKIKLENGVPPLRAPEGARGFSDRFVRVVRRMTRVLPEERYNGYAELKADLDLLVQRQKERRESWRTFFYVHRRKLLQFIIALQVVVMLLLGGTYFYFRLMNKHYLRALENASLDSHWTGEIDTWQQRLDVRKPKRVLTAHAASGPIRLTKPLADGDYVALNMRLPGLGEVVIRLKDVELPDSGASGGKVVVSRIDGRVAVRMFVRDLTPGVSPDTWREVPLPPWIPEIQADGSFNVRLQVLDDGFCLWERSHLLGIGYFPPELGEKPLWLEVDPRGCTAFVIENAVLVEGRFDRYGGFLKDM